MFLEFDPDDVELHSNPNQLTRQNNALRLNVESVDFETRSGKINGYDVSLSSCTCVDFHRNRKPCKHMYRLAHELGIFKLSGTVINDPNVKSSGNLESMFAEMRERDKLKRKIRKLSFESQKILFECICEDKKIFSNDDLNSIAELETFGFVSSRPLYFFDAVADIETEKIVAMCTDSKPARKNCRAEVIRFFEKHYSKLAARTVSEKFGDKIRVDITDIIESHLQTVQKILESNKIES